jgi:hypothetical protein
MFVLGIGDLRTLDFCCCLGPFFSHVLLNGRCSLPIWAISNGLYKMILYFVQREARIEIHMAFEKQL